MYTKRRYGCFADKYCSKSYTGNSGEFSYIDKVNSTCTWTVTSSPGTRINLIVSASLFLQLYYKVVIISVHYDYLVNMFSEISHNL